MESKIYLNNDNATTINTNLNSIVFVDIETDYAGKKLLDIGCVKNDDSKFHHNSTADFTQFIKGNTFVCGHNILKHDINFIGGFLISAGINESYVIDTLPLSPLLFPNYPYHALIKDYKFSEEDINNPLNDAIKCKELFNDEITA